VKPSPFVDWSWWLKVSGMCRPRAILLSAAIRSRAAAPVFFRRSQGLSNRLIEVAAQRDNAATADLPQIDPLDAAGITS
jgi:hypothetical protein